jgi:hypothetical protein
MFQREACPSHITRNPAFPLQKFRSTRSNVVLHVFSALPHIFHGSTPAPPCRARATHLLQILVHPGLNGPARRAGPQRSAHPGPGHSGHAFGFPHLCLVTPLERSHALGLPARPPSRPVPCLGHGSGSRGHVHSPPMRIPVVTPPR